MFEPTRFVSLLGATAALALAPALAPAAAPAKAPHGQLSAADKMWLQTSISGDRFEIQGGQLAQTRAGSQAVKNYGARLVADHTKSLRSAIAIARAHRVQIPRAPTPSEQWELRTVAGQSGAAFDTLYVDLETADHEQDISEAHDEISDGTNRGVRAEARNDLRTLVTHLRIARSLGGKPTTDPTP
jgi:putative membrane protein